jgi:carbon monoxide dehydrogenase subunit G
MARSLIAIIALSTLAGCSAGAAGEVKLGVDVAALKSTTTAQAGSTALDISRVRVLVADAKIGYTGDKSSGGPSAEVGPYVIDLTADEIANGAHREFSLGSLAGGTYGGAEIEIQPLATGTAAPSADFTDFVTAGASVLVDGTYQGTAFSFAGHFLAEQGTDGDVTVDAATPVTIAMTVDPSSWFLNTSGVALDPADTAQHDALAVALCKTLDTQPQLTESAAPGAQPASNGHGPGGGGGDQAHCVEQAAQ